jgi:NTP pyrophosphatase (non-canonical NTP hydrolase)
MVNTRQELLVILMEECGELIQECSKLIRRGEYESQDFTKEVGDVLTLIDLAHKYDMFSYNDTDERYEEKINKLRKWSNLLDGE